MTGRPAHPPPKNRLVAQAAHMPDSGSLPLADYPACGQPVQLAGPPTPDYPDSVNPVSKEVPMMNYVPGKVHDLLREAVPKLCRRCQSIGWIVLPGREVVRCPVCYSHRLER